MNENFNNSVDFKNIAISSRIRLARNFSGFNFFTKLNSEDDAKFIVQKLSFALEKLGDFELIKLKNLSINECNALLERHLISKELIDNKDISAVAISDDEHLIIMMNEEDHIREQCLCDGFNLFRPYREIKRLDDLLLSEIDVAYSEDYGFLTSSPSNLGTGMRASVLLFLPGLVQNGDINLIKKEVKSLGLTVRGLYGEGTEDYGCFYQISNQNSLGFCEQQIIDKVSEYVFQVCQMEQSAREDILSTNHDKLRDEVHRAYGVLKECCLLGEREMIELLSKIKFGNALGLIKITDVKAFDKLLIEGCSANLREISDLDFNKKEKSIRSEYINKEIRQLVTKI